ncbi:hypothetical protein [Plantactinospora endophytica]|uniref:Uncharacterized protein n=1 Tax=Plantactinospora endophytica TaxID=673535 RepID=A0ABQ4EF63_9ACTN|nr:hypothetical protein [Plantactinospora endophytica]GIG93363.1 hypothetical protein Pen02_82990 [Plantactinospora endophytica]
MTMVDNCPRLLDLAEISALYAQLTGVLAGFAFTALVVLLTPTQVDERRSRRSRDNGLLLALFAAFVALVIASLRYSISAGETATESLGRAATLELINGLPFGLAAMMLFQGITLLFESGNAQSSAVWVARGLAVVVAPTLTLYYIANGASDTETARAAEAGTCLVAPVPLLGVTLTWIIAAMLSASLVPRLQPLVLRRWARKVQPGIPIAVIVASVAAALLGGDMGTRAPNFILSSAGISWYLSGTFTLLLMLGLTFAWGHGEGTVATQALQRVDDQQEEEATEGAR